MISELSDKLLVWVCSFRVCTFPSKHSSWFYTANSDSVELKWHSGRAAWQECCSHPLRKNTRARIRFCYTYFLYLTRVKAFSLCLSPLCVQRCSGPFKTPTWQLSWWNQFKGKQGWLFLTKAISQEWGTSARNTMWEFTLTFYIEHLTVHTFCLL